MATVLTDENIKALAERDDGMICHYCNREIYKIEDVGTPSEYGGYRISSRLARRLVQVDHKLPKSIGGPDTLDNLVLCCAKCNQRKGKKTDEEFFEWLKNK